MGDVAEALETSNLIAYLAQVPYSATEKRAVIEDAIEKRLKKVIDA